MKKPSKLLIIDDSEEILTALTNFFTQKKYDVISAANGLDGLKHIEAKDAAFDLIITDLVLPNISGSKVKIDLAHRRGVDLGRIRQGPVASRAHRRLDQLPAGDGLIVASEVDGARPAALQGPNAEARRVVVVDQRDQPVADQVRRRLEPSREQQHDRRHQLVLRQPVAVIAQPDQR